MSRGLTIRQVEVVEMIRSFQSDHGYAPTVREITVSFGWRSTRATICHLEAIQKKGAIKREPGRARTIQVLAVGEE
jgi:repressor LexA